MIQFLHQIFTSILKMDISADKERKAVIANLEKAKEGLAGKTGTTITA